MQTHARQLGLIFGLLLVFLVAALAAQAWLQRETRRLQAEAVTVRQTQLLRIVDLLRRPAEAWDDAFARDLGVLLDATVELLPVAAPARAPAGTLSFEHTFAGPGGRVVRVTFIPPAGHRLLILHQRMLAATVLLALLLLVLPLVVALLRRAPAESGSGSPWPESRSEMTGLEHFARISVERGVALERESGARRRAEEDLEVNRSLLDQSLGERVQLGRDLHDNLSQTLYAVSLTLESIAKKLGSGAPPEVTPRLEQCIAELRRLNREVRTYIRLLEPEVVQRRPFLDALRQMLTAIAPDEALRLEEEVDPEAAALVPSEHAAEVVNILREAVSNALRHAHPRTIRVRARPGDHAVVLAVEDDGAGFDPAAIRDGGHGLANMRARAAALGGTLQIAAAPGKGTRIELILPIPSSA